MFTPKRKSITHTKEFTRELTEMIFSLVEASINQERPEFVKFLIDNDIDLSEMEKIIDKTRQKQRIEALQRFNSDPEFRRTITQLVISKRALLAKNQLEQTDIGVNPPI